MKSVKLAASPLCGVAVSISRWSLVSRSSSPRAYRAVFLEGGVHDILCASSTITKSQWT